VVSHSTEAAKSLGLEVLVAQKVNGDSRALIPFFFFFNWDQL
jgi:hypothetical protein